MCPVKGESREGALLQQQAISLLTVLCSSALTGSKLRRHGFKLCQAVVKEQIQPPAVGNPVPRNFCLVQPAVAVVAWVSCSMQLSVCCI